MGIAGKKRGRDTSTTPVKHAAADAAGEQAINVSSGNFQRKSRLGSKEARWDAAKTFQQAARADSGQQTQSVPRPGAFIIAQHSKQMAASTLSEDGCLPGAPQRARRSKNKFKPEPKPMQSLSSEGAQLKGASHTGEGAAAQYAVAGNESSQAPAAPPVTSQKRLKSKCIHNAGIPAPAVRKGPPQETPEKGREGSGAPQHAKAGPRGLNSQQTHTGRQYSKHHAHNSHAEHWAVGASGRFAVACKRSEAGTHDSSRGLADDDGARSAPAARAAVQTFTAAPLPG